MACALVLGVLLLPGLAAAQAPQPAVTRRPAEYGVIVEKNVMIPVRDGVRLAADIYRPARDGKPAAGRFPALLTRTPYDKRARRARASTTPSEATSSSPTTCAGGTPARGPGRLASTTRRTATTSSSGSPAQEWSDGKVGTFGTSYPGGTQHALAEMNPPHLTTMVPIDALSNCGVSGMRHGGAFELRFMNWIFQTGAPNSKAALANPALRQALLENGRRIREHADSLPVRPGNTPLRVVPEYEAWLVEAMRSGPESPFWHIKGMSVVDHVGDYADVPVLHVTGWYDSWTRQVTMNYEALSKAKKSPQRLLIGPWVHGVAGLERRRRGRVHRRRRDRPPGLAAAVVRPLAARGSRTEWTTIRRSSSTSWGRATTGARRAGGSSTAASGGPSANGRSPGPGPRTYYLHADGTLATSPPSEASEPHDLHLRPASTRCRRSAATSPRTRG